MSDIKKSCDPAQQEIRNLRYEAQRHFGIPREEDLIALYQSHQGKDSVWNYLSWGECEWRYGWPQAVALALTQLKVRTIMDFGSGVGVVPLYLYDKLRIQPVMADRPGPWRELLSYRCGRRTITSPTEPEKVLQAGAGPWDAVMALETMEHIPEAGKLLLQLADKAKLAVIISGAMGRPDSDKDPLHIFKGPLAPILLQHGFSLWRGGGMPWVFVRTEAAQMLHLQLIGLDGKAL